MILLVKKELDIESAPTEPIPLDVRLEIANLQSQGLNAEKAYRECRKFVQTKRAGVVDSDVAAVWIVKYPTFFTNLYMNWKGSVEKCE